jgi:hypothetical protein
MGGHSCSEDANPLDVAGQFQVLDALNRFLWSCRGHGAPAYLPEIVARNPGSMRTSPGVALVAERGFDAPAAPIDTLLVAADWGLEAALDDHCAGVARVETVCFAEGALEVSPVVISDRQADVDDLDTGIGQPAC